MGSLDLSDLPERPLLLLDSAPIIYVLESHPVLRPRFRPLFEAQERGEARFAVTTVAFAEVLVGAMKIRDDELVRRYRELLGSWRVVDLDRDIAEKAARLRAALGLKLSDSIQAASALAIEADALVTYDRDFSRLKTLRVIT